MAFTFKNINDDEDYLAAKKKADQYGEYKESEYITGLKNKRDDILYNQQPEKWNSELMSKDKLKAYDAWKNRPDFSYDVNGDALYQQYKDQYMTQGKLAMMDTMGQAAAMTGGYGNSYAASVGNQAYQGYLQKLNEVVPELYNMAYNQYLQEGEDLKYAYEAASQEYNQKYAENMDAHTLWNNAVNTANSILDTESSREQGAWNLNNVATSAALDRVINKFNTTEANRFSAYQQVTTEKQWQDTYDLQERQVEASEEANRISASAKTGGMTKEMTAAEIADQLQAYKESGDNVGAETFIDILEADGIISGEDADLYYNKYFPEEKPLPTFKRRFNNPLLGIIYPD